MKKDLLNTLRFLPVAIDLHGKSCVVVGGGEIGTRKVSTLLRAGAIVTVISPEVSVPLTEVIEAGRVHWIAEAFREELLGEAYLIVVATDDELLNAEIVRLADRRRALVCDASSADRSQVIFGALLQRDDLTVAVFTGGRDPGKSRRTRDKIERFLSGHDEGLGSTEMDDEE